MAVPKIMLQRLQTMGAKILSQSDDAIRFVTKKGDDISMQWGKREVFDEMKDYVTSWSKSNEKTGVAANLKRKLSEGITTSRLTTETTHINENLGLSYDTYARHVFEDSGDLKCFNFERTHYDFSQANQMAMGNCILTDDGLKLAFTIAKGQDARFNSITQGIQKINCQW